MLGVDGSLSGTGRNLAAKGHVFDKTGTTVEVGQDGKTLMLKAQNLAGYIQTKSGHLVAYALMVNNAGPLKDFAADVSSVFTDEGEISDLIYQAL
ncbi:MAG: hypothetical protein ACR2P2_04990 [Nakamurella sp.]